MEFDWKDIDIPESKEPTEPRRAIFSEASVKSKRELLMADFLITTTALPFDLELDEIAEPVKIIVWKPKFWVNNSINIASNSKLSTKMVWGIKTFY